VGGKSAHLSRLAADYHVPSGFCLTAAAFDPAYPVDAPVPPALAAALAAAPTFVYAQANTADTAAGMRAAQTTTTYTDNDDDSGKWGWIGLLGLAGLLGMRRRDHVHHTDRVNTMDSTRRS
jgi:MYXO-CTERM domain-containing protein